MSTQPAYAAAPVVGVANISTANTARDGTGTITQLVVGRVPGTRIERIEYRATVTTTAGMVRIFKKDSGLTLSADGTVSSYSAGTWRLIKELTVSAVTVGANTEAANGSWAPTGGIALGPFEQLGVSTHAAEAINVIAYGGHL